MSEARTEKNDLDRYNEALSRRAAGRATLCDAVAIARGRPGPPAEPVAFDGELPEGLRDPIKVMERVREVSVSPPTTLHRAECPWCSTRIPLRPDGTFMAHSFASQRCHGEGRKP